MRIAVNLRQYYKGKIGGMENYVRNILAGLQQHALTIWVHESEVANVRDFAPAARIIGLTNQQGAGEIGSGLRSGTFDLFFCPLLVLEPLVVSQPSAVMMPDVQHEFFPEYFEERVLQWRQRTYRPTALNADVVFTLSEHAKQTIVDKFRIDPAKVRVIHLDADQEFKAAPAPAATAAFRALKLPANYLYFPANFWPHKNHSNVLQALQIAARDVDVHLVLSGSTAGSDKVLAEARALGIAGRVHFKGYLDKQVIPEVYRNSLGLLFATKFEGFGIPILEAFHCGTAVITAHSGSCVEVAGDAAVRVDPLSPESIAGGILRLLREPGLRESIASQGPVRARQFSWQRAVELTESAFREITSAQYQRPSRISLEEWPRIGIVTPTYNMAGFLEEAIQSVLSQDYPNLDYVVIDGGSRDGTVEILRKYESKLRWVSERDGGQADAINKGWHTVDGEIFAYLNADDTYLPNALSTIARHFRQSPGVGMIYGEAYHVDVSGGVIDRYPTQPFDYETLNSQCYICQPAAFLLREVYLDAGMINAEMHFAIDYDLWIRVAKICGVKKVNEYLATSRMHLDNKTLSSRRRVYQEIIATVKAQYGYVPYEWLNGYACYKLDKKDQYFERSRPSLQSYGLSLLLGGYHNPHNLRRYWKEWRKMTGIGNSFTGHWEDGWISRRFEQELDVATDSRVLRIAGSHVAPIEKLQLRILLDGRTLEHTQLPVGRFQLEMPVPADLRGKQCRLLIETDRTWRPAANGDYRQLSCIIDTLEQAADART